MNTLTLPALDGRKALGFLAAIGVTRLLEIYDADAPRLAWAEDSSTAVLHTRHKSVDAVADRLGEIVQSIPDDGVLPGVPPELPPPGEAPDRLRVPPAALRELAAELAPEVKPEVEAWLASLVTDLSLDAQGRSDISLMAAPSGKQSMRTMLEKPLLELRKNPHCLYEALVGWRRYSGVTGEYLDHQALFDAVDSGSGKPENRGVPGATWLALMSYPLLRTTATGRQPITSGWHVRSRQQVTFLYPLWTAPVDCDAIVALLEHPLWEEAVDGPLPSEASAFSVFAVHRFRRRTIGSGKSRGVLAPAI